MMLNACNLVHFSGIVSHFIWSPMEDMKPVAMRFQYYDVMSLTTKQKKRKSYTLTWKVGHHELVNDNYTILSLFLANTNIFHFDVDYWPASNVITVQTLPLHGPIKNQFFSLLPPSVR